MSKIQVIPGILEVDSEEFESKLLQASKFSDKVFIDIIDGKFAPNMTIGMDELIESSTELAIYIQLMTEEPIDYLNQCSELGAELVVGHVELMEDQVSFIKKGIKLGLKIGFALDLVTPVDFIEDEALEKAKAILLMAVPAGFSEQTFDRKVLGKIIELRKSGFKGEIFVDGGVNGDTIKDCVEAGASALSITSGIWKTKDPATAYSELVKLANR